MTTERGNAIHQRLRNALEPSNYAARRNELRALTFECLSEITTDEKVAKLFNDSPLIGKGPKQVKPRPNLAGLRDSLRHETMIALIDAWAIGRHDEVLSEISFALVSPVMHATTNENSRTGFGIGWHKSHTHERAEMIERSLKARFTAGAVDVTAPKKEKKMLDTTTTAPEPEPEAKAEPKPPTKKAKPVAGAWALPSGDSRTVIDFALTSAGLPKIEAMLDSLNGAEDEARALREKLANAEEQLAHAEARAAGVVAGPPAGGAAAVPSKAGKGKVVTKVAGDVFAVDGPASKAMFAFDVPVFEWAAAHPDVPEVDGDYIFRPMELFKVLQALIGNQRMYLRGHTGTGKTTLLEQVAARLKWPFIRVNFDSEITRMDLIGRDTLVSDGKATLSKFVDGVLPQALTGPYLLCLDEIDFIRPDVAYVMQRVLEGDGLVLTEDGGRWVEPHRMSRLMATGNTSGQGDEYGMYPGARPQSMALLDRFTMWAEIEYLSTGDRAKLLQRKVPGLDSNLMNRLLQYVEEHQTAFLQAKVLQPMSPRTAIAMGQAIKLWTEQLPPSMRPEAIKQAVKETVLDRATQQDRAVLAAIAQRVFALSL